jgi:4-diphosphocytidyl-2-C-methyl-D-erythritol kinase
MVKWLRATAPAKINLFLRVTGRRPDGYHEIDSIFLPVSLCDSVYLELRPSRSASVELNSSSSAIPSGEANLAFRAARRYMDEFGIRAEVLIRLQKEIPAGAGLGGGSSDAGTVLRMMAKLCGAKNTTALSALAARLGADVPFFLNPVPSRVRGIGEKIEPLPSMPRLFAALAIPPIVVPTVSVFGELHPHHWSGPAPEQHVSAIVEGRILPDYLVNDLQAVAIAKWPRILRLKELIDALGARASGMSGSGGSIFGIFDSAEETFQACREIARRAPDVRSFAVCSGQS